MTAEKRLTSRLDDLFSPEKLRRNWQIKALPVLESPQISVNIDIHNQYYELQHLISKKYPGAFRLAETFNELSEAINRAFPLGDTSTECVDAKSKEAVIVLLEQLEELLWALDLSQQGGG